jgi:transglutaminase-like putative cysteine protease
MYYTVRHTTRFTYDSPISESVMEARMQPRSEAAQRCIHFGLSTTPASRVMMYQDHDGNIVHHFNIPGRHGRLTVTAQALVESHAVNAIPERLSVGAWDQLDALVAGGEYWDAMAPSTFARSTPLLEEFSREIAIERGVADPLTTLKELTREMFDRFEYKPRSTRVDSPIDDALLERRGVCQDFTHIMTALVRRLGIPCRYVSGYLFHQQDSADRSADGATHAWVEALLPDLGWVGFDPTNNLLAGERHIRVAIGRDYSDVPPTRGVYKGATAVRTELAVAVKVGPVQMAIAGEALPFVPWMSREAGAPMAESLTRQQQQQQQQ